MAIFRRKYRTEAAQNTTESEKEERRKAHKHAGKRTNDQIYPELKRAAGENKVRGLKKKNLLEVFLDGSSYMRSNTCWDV